VWNNAGPHDPIETRIAALEKNLIELRNQIDRLRTDNDSRFRAQNEKFETEVTNRNKEISELRTKLEATETGGLHLSAYGTVWIFIGVIMSTLSVELAWPLP
jgi:predicted RNase H-like nuclease (RuvC/YqgF family)